MRKIVIIIIYLLVSFFLIFLSRQGEYDPFTLVGDFIDYFIVFLISSVLAILIYTVVKQTCKREIKSFQFYSYWLSILIISTVVFQVIKYDPYPYTGSFDEWWHKGLIEKSRIQDSIYIVDGYPDSTIMETNSIDTTKNGIYIWLNHKEIFVRKHTTNFDSQRQEDSVTMSIVKGWSKK